jgi:putative endonuclease
MSDKQYYVYILTTSRNTALYTGVTNDLIRRIYEHKNGLVDGFAKRYKVHKLVHYEVVGDILAAIAREKQIKSWNRDKKVTMIDTGNPGWQDLYETIIGGQILTSFRLSRKLSE